MKITEIWFAGEYIYGKDENGKEYRQSLLWYPRLLAASEDERKKYTISTIGIHWRNINEDVSFESFEYEEAEPSKLQRFFLTHKEINVAEFAKLVGIRPHRQGEINKQQGKNGTNVTPDKIISYKILA